MCTIYQYHHMAKLTNTLQFITCKYNCTMSFQSLSCCLRHIDWDKIYFHERLAHEITTLLYKCWWIFDLIQIFLTRRLMKWVMNENSICQCLFYLSFNQIYTANVCRNYPCAIIKFVELQVRTFSSFIIIFKQIFFDIELSKATCDK